jgi:hypothetical protein
MTPVKLGSTLSRDQSSRRGCRCHLVNIAFCSDYCSHPSINLHEHHDLYEHDLLPIRYCKAPFIVLQPSFLLHLLLYLLKSILDNSRNYQPSTPCRERTNSFPTATSPHTRFYFPRTTDRSDLPVLTFSGILNNLEIPED